MLPSVVVGVREWPRTSSAKIDRNRLPAPEGGSGAAAEVVAPRSAAERAARDAIAAVLGLPAEGVSVEAGFFELGCLRTQIAVLHTAIGLISAASLALTHLISSLPPTGGNSLHAVRCVSLLNIQLAANQQVTNLANLLSVGPTLHWPHPCIFSLSGINYTTNPAPGLSSHGKCLSSSNCRSAGKAHAIT
jgi:hypothetical protein